MAVPASLSKWAHPPRSNAPRSSSSGPPGPCITPSTETCTVVVSFMVAVPSRWLVVVESTGPLRRSHPAQQRRRVSTRNTAPRVGDVPLVPRARRLLRLVEAATPLAPPPQRHRHHRLHAPLIPHQPRRRASERLEVRRHAAELRLEQRAPRQPLEAERRAQRFERESIATAF